MDNATAAQMAQHKIADDESHDLQSPRWIGNPWLIDWLIDW